MARSDYSKLETDIVDFFNKVKLQLALPIDMKFIFQSATKQKKLIKITKLPDHYAEALNADVLVQINESYFDSFDEEINTILIEQEIGRIEFNLDKGTFKLVQPDFSTSFGILKKYSTEKVRRAIETEKLYEKIEEK
jgi:pyruvate/2-oxoglutarate/acetoin dehydrogenase E1 component